MPVMKKNFVIILAALAAITVFIDPRTAAQSPPGLSSTVWHSQDIGKPGMTGRFVENGDLLEVYGSGADIWGAADACHFVNVLWQEDVEIVAKVLGVEGTDPWAKAGLMLRDSLEDTSPQVMLAMTPEKGVTLIRRNQSGNRSEDDAHQAMRLVSVPGKRTFQQRGSAGVDTAKDAITSVGFPRWLKLIKRGDVIAAYDSKDAREWLWLGTIRQSFGQKFYLGLAVASHDNTKICRASFSDIQITLGISAGPPAFSNGSITWSMLWYFHVPEGANNNVPAATNNISQVGALSQDIETQLTVTKQASGAYICTPDGSAHWLP